ncbi:hypothetical protein SARC_12666, partial [Sphaeroforma arctica JP610]
MSFKNGLNLTFSPGGHNQPDHWPSIYANSNYTKLPLVNRKQYSEPLISLGVDVSVTFVTSPKEQLPVSLDITCSSTAEYSSERFIGATVLLEGPSILLYDLIRNFTLPSKNVTFVASKPDIVDSGLLSGNYSLHVIVYVQALSGQNFKAYAVPGSPFNITVDELEEELGHNPLPACKSGYTRAGQWVHRQDLPRMDRALGNDEGPFTRNGWSWRPFECKIEAFPIWQLPLSAKPLWIMFVGTSTIRGLYWTLMDMVAPPIFTNEITNTTSYKCWGVLDFSIGNIRVTYRDFRYNWPPTMLKSNSYYDLADSWLSENICPISNTSGATALSRKGWAMTPDVIVMEELQMTTEYHNNTGRLQCLEIFEGRGGVLIPVSLKPRVPQDLVSSSAAQHSLLSSKYEGTATGPVGQTIRHFLDIYPLSAPLFNHDRVRP